MSLSEGIRSGKASFAELGMERAYTGAPSEATVEEGCALYDKLTTMIATEITEAIARRSGA